MGEKVEVVNMSENSNVKIESKGVIKCDSKSFGSFITTYTPSETGFNKVIGFFMSNKLSSLDGM